MTGRLTFDPNKGTNILAAAGQVRDVYAVLAFYPERDLEPIHLDLLFNDVRVTVIKGMSEDQIVQAYYDTRKEMTREDKR